MAKPFKNLRDKMNPEARAAAETKTRKLLGGLEEKTLMKKKYKSRLSREIHETAAGLHRIGLIPATTMQEFDESCLTKTGTVEQMTRPFREIVQARIAADPKFRTLLLIEAVTAISAGESDVGAALLKDFNATIQIKQKSKWWIAKIPELDFVAQGETKAKALDNLKEVIGIQKVPLTQHRDNYELPAEVDFSDAVRGKFSKRGSKPHPGEILKHDFMDPQKITIAKLSKYTGIGQQDLRNIIKGEAGIDVHDAKALGEFFKNGVEYWINLHARTQPKRSLTRSFRETIQKMAAEDPKFRKGLLTEAIDAMLDGEPGVTQSLLRDYVLSGEIDITALRKSFNNFIRMAEAIQREVGAKGADMCVGCHLQEKLRNPNFKAAYEREGEKIDRVVRKTTAKASAKKKK